MPVCRMVVVPLVLLLLLLLMMMMMIIAVSMSMSMSIRIFGLLLLFSVAIVTITARAVVSASLPWSAALLAAAAASPCGLVGIIVVGILAPPSVALLSGIGTSGCGIVPCHWLLSIRVCGVEAMNLRSLVEQVLSTVSVSTCRCGCMCHFRDEQTAAGYNGYGSTNTATAKIRPLQKSYMPCKGRGLQRSAH